MSIQRFLTNGGNILQINPNGDKMFATPKMKFIREVSDDEAEFLSKECMPISLPVYSDGLGNVELPIWKYLWSVIDSDESKLVGSKVNNGGAYAEYTERSYYMAQMPYKEWQVRVITRNWSSSEFQQDDTGHYTNNIQLCHLQNVEGDVKIRYQGSEDFNDVIERHSDITSIENALQDTSITITSPYTWDGRLEYESEVIESIVTFATLRKKAERLKELGFTRQKNKSKINKRGNGPYTRR